ncbi:MAG: ribosome small subunit-dependent GTPase A [Planctomycetota bacterium]|nr:ribosome small subunit-dependent GTPase A [Planctomycetota bacterium]
MSHLNEWGWSAALEARYQPELRDGTVPARVLEEQRDAYTVVAADGFCRAHAAGRLRHHAIGKEALPAVGDWVALERPSLDRGVIQSVLSRQTVLVRKDAGRTATAQVIAANVDVVFLMTSLNAELEPRRVERYLATIWESGAQPVLLLSKADLAEDPEASVDALADVTLGVPVHVLSALEDTGVEPVRAQLAPGRTFLLVGSSGVGKSTLLNRLAGDTLQVVRAIRASDDRGVHTTTARRMVRLPSGALLVDTPGMRELGLWDAADGLEEAFADVGALSADCRFRDCTHDGEPGCAVRAAIETGALDPERLASYGKLKREMLHLARKTDKRAAREHTRMLKLRHRSYARAARQRKVRRGE